MARRNLLLPLDYSHPLPEEVSDISAMLDRVATASLNPLQKEAALLIRCVLDTGQHPETILKTRLSQPGKTAVPSLCLSGDPSWRFAMVTPNEDQRDANLNREFVHLRSEFITFPVGQKLLECLAGQRPAKSSLFAQNHATVIAQARHLLRHRRCPDRILFRSEIERVHCGCGRHPRRATTTLAALMRIKRQALLSVAGQHPSIALATLGHSLKFLNASSCYGALPYSVARNPGRRDLGRSLELFANENWVGGRYCPKDSVLARMSADLTAAVDKASSPDARHNALMEWTVAQFCVATGHRATRTGLPDPAAIDVEIGLLWIQDKDANQALRERRVWVPSEVRTSLRTFAEHVGGLPPASKPKRRRGADNRGRQKLPIFHLENGQPRSTNLARVMADIAGRYSLPANFARHWLKANLVGQCSHETIDAMLGHWLDGANPNSASSCLDPLLYAADIKRSLVPLLIGVGWLKNTGADQPSDSQTFEQCFPDTFPHEGESYPFKGRYRILWSAIRNGAFLLDKKDWGAFFRSLDQSPRENDLALYIAGTHGLYRWLPDLETEQLIRDWRAKNLPPHADEAVRRQQRQALIDRLPIARASWRNRLPPLLFSHACGGLNNRSLPPETWARLLAPRKADTSAKPASLTVAKQQFSNEVWDQIFQKAHDDRQKGKLGLLTIKRQAARSLIKAAKSFDADKANEADKFRFAAMLLLAQRRPPNAKGYAPSTAKDYAKHAFTRATKPRTHVAYLFQHFKQFDSQVLSDLLDRFDSGEKGATNIKFPPLPPISKPRGRGAFDAEELARRDDVEDRHGKLISLNEWENAFDMAALHEPLGLDIQLALFLGFWCGLREEEIRNFRLKDAMVTDDKVTHLVVARTAIQTTKNFPSRRVIPVGIMGFEHHRDILNRRILELRARTPAGTNPVIFGSPDLYSRGETSVVRAAERCLAAATGIEETHFRDLRHSFASYSLASVLFPADCPVEAIPASLWSVISPYRGNRIRTTLLGEETLGRSILHALGQMLGHAGLDMNIGTYSHLLDVSLHLFADRKRTIELNAQRPEGRYEIPALQIRPHMDRYEKQSGRPDGQGSRRPPMAWLDMQALLDKPYGEIRSLLSAYGLKEEMISEWRRAVEPLCSTLRSKEGNLSLPIGDWANQFAKKVWANLDSPPDDLGILLSNFRPNRTIYRLPNDGSADALKLYFDAAFQGEAWTLVASGRAYKAAGTLAPLLKDPSKCAPKSDEKSVIVAIIIVPDPKYRNPRSRIAGHRNFESEKDEDQTGCAQPGMGKSSKSRETAKLSHAARYVLTLKWAQHLLFSDRSGNDGLLERQEVA